MKRIIILVVLATTGVAFAVPGEQWILPIHHRDGGGWVEHPGSGYGGTSAWEGNTIDGVRRVYWELSGTGSLGNPVDATTELYTIEWWRPLTGPAGWQPIESQFKGINGETWPMEPLIPWAGAYGTNHQYIGAENGTPGQWVATGPGPHTPEDATYTASPNGTYMWLTNGSWLYVKWDFGWPIEHTWSALRLTQITPEPASALLLLLGAPLLRRRSR